MNNKSSGPDKLIPFTASVKAVLEDVPDLESMDLAALEEYYADLKNVLQKLDEAEPRNENSEAYDIWAEEHEDLEDLMDEVLELIEDMK